MEKIVMVPADQTAGAKRAFAKNTPISSQRNNSAIQWNYCAFWKQRNYRKRGETCTLREYLRDVDTRSDGGQGTVCRRYKQTAWLHGKSEGPASYFRSFLAPLRFRALFPGNPPSKGNNFVSLLSVCLHARMTGHIVEYGYPLLFCRLKGA